MKKFLLLIIFCGSSILIQAQTTVTFNINLVHLMEDSTFVPGRDMIQVTGNFSPLGINRWVQMDDEEPIDSIYTAEIKFSPRYDDQELKYNFEIVTPNEKKTEDIPRMLKLQSKKIELPPLYFNSFAM